MNRGERRQSHIEGMNAEGAGPGPPDRFYRAAHAPDSELQYIREYNKKISDLILASTDG